MLLNTGPKAFIAWFSGHSSHKFELSVMSDVRRANCLNCQCTYSVLEYKSLNNFRPISSILHLLRRLSHLLSIAWFTVHENITSDHCYRMTKNVSAYSLSYIADSHLFITQCNVMDILVAGGGGWGGGGWKCENAWLLNMYIHKATTKTTIFFLAKIQII